MLLYCLYYFCIIGSVSLIIKSKLVQLHMLHGYGAIKNDKSVRTIELIHRSKVNRVKHETRYTPIVTINDKKKRAYKINRIIKMMGKDEIRLLYYISNVKNPYLVGLPIILKNKAIEEIRFIVVSNPHRIFKFRIIVSEMIKEGCFEIFYLKILVRKLPEQRNDLAISKNDLKNSKKNRDLTTKISWGAKFNGTYFSENIKNHTRDKILGFFNLKGVFVIYGIKYIFGDEFFLLRQLENSEISRKIESQYILTSLVLNKYIIHLKYTSCNNIKKKNLPECVPFKNHNIRCDANGNNQCVNPSKSLPDCKKNKNGTVKCRNKGQFNHSKSENNDSQKLSCKCPIGFFGVSCQYSQNCFQIKNYNKSDINRNNTFDMNSTSDGEQKVYKKRTQHDVINFRTCDYLSVTNDIFQLNCKEFCVCNYCKLQRGVIECNCLIDIFPKSMNFLKKNYIAVNICFLLLFFIIFYPLISIKKAENKKSYLTVLCNLITREKKNIKYSSGTKNENISSLYDTIMLYDNFNNNQINFTEYSLSKYDDPNIFYESNIYMENKKETEYNIVYEINENSHDINEDEKYESSSNLSEFWHEHLENYFNPDNFNKNKNIVKSSSDIRLPMEHESTQIYDEVKFTDD